MLPGREKIMAARKARGPAVYRLILVAVIFFIVEISSPMRPSLTELIRPDIPTTHSQPPASGPEGQTLGKSFISKNIGTSARTPFRGDPMQKLRFFLLLFGCFLISSSMCAAPSRINPGRNQFRPKKLFYFAIILRLPGIYLKL